MDENTSKRIQPGIDFFRALTDLLPEAFLLLTRSGRILASNRAAAGIFGRDSIENNCLGSLVAGPPEKVARSLRLWSESGSMIPATLTLSDGSVIRADGARITVEGMPRLLVRCVPRSQAFATRELARHSLDYLSFQKNIAEKLAVARQQKETAETTAAMFAHEVANPLNSISTALDVLELEAQNNSLGRLGSEILTGAKEEIARLSALLSDFRSLARPQVLDLKPVDLAQLIGEVVAAGEAAMREGGIALAMELEPGLPPVRADKNRLKQAILNIQKNAVEAMPEGGRMTVAAHAANGIVVLEVRDTGVGIPAGLDPFQVFKTTKTQGTGLGLPIAAQIIALHKGRIEYRSEAPGGTTFLVYLPVFEQQEPALFQK